MKNTGLYYSLTLEKEQSVFNFSFSLKRNINRPGKPLLLHFLVAGLRTNN